MDIGPLPVETPPTPADVQFLEDRLHEYNEAQTGITGIIICGNGFPEDRDGHGVSQSTHVGRRTHPPC